MQKLQNSCKTFAPQKVYVTYSLSNIGRAYDLRQTPTASHSAEINRNFFSSSAK